MFCWQLYNFSPFKTAIVFVFKGSFPSSKTNCVEPPTNSLSPFQSHFGAVSQPEIPTITVHPHAASRFSSIRHIFIHINKTRQRWRRRLRCLSVRGARRRTPTPIHLVSFFPSLRRLPSKLNQLVDGSGRDDTRKTALRVVTARSRWRDDNGIKSCCWTVSILQQFEEIRASSKNWNLKIRLL